MHREGLERGPRIQREREAHLRASLCEECTKKNKASSEVPASRGSGKAGCEPSHSDAYLERFGAASGVLRRSRWFLTKCGRACCVQCRRLTVERFVQACMSPTPATESASRVDLPKRAGDSMQLSFRGTPRDEAGGPKNESLVGESGTSGLTPVELEKMQLEEDREDPQKATLGQTTEINVSVLVHNESSEGFSAPILVQTAWVWKSAWNSPGKRGGIFPNGETGNGHLTGSGTADGLEDLTPLVFRVCMFRSETLQIELAENDDDEEEDDEEGPPPTGPLTELYTGPLVNLLPGYKDVLEYSGQIVTTEV